MASNTLPRQSLRSEKMLHDVLVKDGVARHRSLSRGSSSAPRMVRPVDTTAPPMPPVDSPAIQRSIVRSNSSSADSSGDERPMIATNGLGATTAVLYRPHMPAPRKTHDGASFPRSTSPSPPHHPHPHRTATSPGPPFHENMIHGGHSPTAEWAYEESSSPGGMSFTSSGCNSGSASHLPGTPSTPFNLQLANEYCRQQSGYVSFGEVEGLGWPAGEEEDERLERQKLEIESKRKNRWLAWFEDAGLSLSRPKTPAHPQDAE